LPEAECHVSVSLAASHNATQQQQQYGRAGRRPTCKNEGASETCISICRRLQLPLRWCLHLCCAVGMWRLCAMRGGAVCVFVCVQVVCTARHGGVVVAYSCWWWFCFG
jgi:hypothetical protein